jgi:hypothetical protein
VGSFVHSWEVTSLKPSSPLTSVSCPASTRAETPSLVLLREGRVRGKGYHSQPAGGTAALGILKATRSQRVARPSDDCCRSCPSLLSDRHHRVAVSAETGHWWQWVVGVTRASPAGRCLHIPASSTLPDVSAMVWPPGKDSRKQRESSGPSQHLRSWSCLPAALGIC